MPRYRPIRWTQSQVERLERAVNAYNDAIDDAAARYDRQGLAFLLPPKTNISDEIDSIQTASQLNMRVSSLNRILKTDALDIDVAHQMTNYEYHEGVVAKSVVNRWRIQHLKAIGGELRTNKKGRYEPANTYTRRLINETSLMPNQQAVSRENVHHFQRLALQYSGGNVSALATYYINYLRAWTDYYSWAPEYNVVVNLLNELMQQDVDTINNVFYDYDYYGSFDYLYPAADRTPLMRKARNIANYWRDMKRKWWGNAEG